MSPEIRKLINWYDAKMGRRLDFDELVKGLSECVSVPRAHQEPLRKFKKKSRTSRESLVASYLIEVIGD